MSNTVQRNFLIRFIATLIPAFGEEFGCWIGYGFIALEGLILLTFKSHCPLNLLARKYSNSTQDNFDIYLPSWLAKYTKLIYTTIFALITIITIYQMLN